MMKKGNMNQLFLAKNKNEDADLGWTADIKKTLINYKGPVEEFFLMARSVTEL